MLTKAWISYQDEDGYCNVCSANSYLRRAKSDFDPRTFGAASLPQLLQRYPELYRVERFPGKGTVTIVGFRWFKSESDNHAGDGGLTREQKSD